MSTIVHTSSKEITPKLWKAGKFPSLMSSNWEEFPSSSLGKLRETNCRRKAAQNCRNVRTSNVACNVKRATSETWKYLKKKL